MMTVAPQNSWQTTIESGVETGQTPLLDLGLSPGILPSLATLLTLTTFAAERLDPTTPLVVIGGESSSWVWALLATPQTAPPQRAPALAITFGGTDQATQLATVGLYQSSTRTPMGHGPHELPRGFVTWFAPVEPSSASRGDAWPFTFWQSDVTELRSADDRWLQWSGFLLGVGLLMAALLV